jgi:hypothetical protein
VRRLAALLLASALAASAGAAAGRSAHGAVGRFFLSRCTFSHEARDDPIVLPGRPEASHDHTFVGNTSTNAFSTLASLRRAGTTCDRPGDTAAYWAPTLFAAGRPVFPESATIYYRRLTLAPVRPFPPGLRMVAGNSHAVAPQPRRITSWSCSVVKENFYGPLRRAGAAPAAAPAYSSGIPTCSPYASLELVVDFPDCWNGRTLDSPDHASHMAYSSDGRCPPGHPVAVPAIELVYTYPPGVDTADAFLASGGQYSGHADFINAWRQAALASLVASCLDSGRTCSVGVVSSSAR